MKTFWLVILAAAAAWGQSACTGNGTSSGTASWGGSGGGSAATAVGPEFFGMHVHSPATQWQTVPATGMRVWGTTAYWGNMSPSGPDGNYVWNNLDAWIDKLDATNTYGMITLIGGGPGWITANPSASCPIPSLPGSCLPPVDVNSDGTGTDAHFIAFVDAFMGHLATKNVHKRLIAIGTGNEPQAGYWNSNGGTNAQMARMGKDLYQHVKAANAGMLVLSPEPSGGVSGPGIWFASYCSDASNPMQYADVIAFHNYSWPATGEPNDEDVRSLIDNVETALKSCAYTSGKERWVTEGSWGGGNWTTDSDDTRHQGWIARHYLHTLDKGVKRYYWFAWDNTGTNGLTDGTTWPNKAGTAYGQLYNWLVGATPVGHAAKDASNNWTWEVTRASGYAAVIAWNKVADTSYTPASKFTRYRDLNGDTHAITGAVTLTEAPVILETGAPPMVQVATTVLPAAGSGLAYSYGLAAGGGRAPYTWMLSDGPLPAGLNMDSSGAITGNATALGSYPLQVEVVDADGNGDSAKLTLTVQASLAQAAEPQVWVHNPSEGDTTSEGYGALHSPDLIKRVKADGSGDYPYSCAGLQSAVDDWAADGADDNWQVVIDPGLVCAKGGPVLQLKPKLNATKFLAMVSSNPPTRGQTLCSHRTRDNDDGSSPRNPGCTNDIAHLWHVRSTTNSTNVIDTNSLTDTAGNGPHNYVLYDFEADPDPSLTSPNSPIRLGTGSENTVTAMPKHIHIGYFYVHGDAGDSFTAGGLPGNNSLPNGIVINCPYCSIGYGYMDKMIRPGGEGHGIWSSQNTGPFKIHHTWQEGESIGLFFGGATPTIGGVVAAQDGEVRDNRFTFPAAWLLASWSQSVGRKNAAETKESIRVVYDGNIFENVDNSGGQAGACFSQAVRACSAGTACDNYSAVTMDSMITNNIMRHCMGLQDDAHSGGASAGVSASLGGRRLNYINNLIYDLDGAKYCSASGVGPCSPVRVPGFGSTVATFTCSATRDAAGVNSTLTCADGGTGKHQTDMSAGDAVSVACPSDATFNSGQSSLGTPALVGTAASGLSVVYANPGTANATTTGCTLNAGQGYWSGMIWQHNTVVGNSGSSNTFGPYQNTATSFASNASFVDNLFALSGWGGLTCSGKNEATGSEGCWDLNTLNLHHNVFAERSSSKYTEYVNGISNSGNPTLWFPAAVPCAGNTATPGCVGFAGMMNGAAFNQNPADWHGFALSASSVFSAGGSSDASDGKDVGADLSKIDAAQQSTKYACRGACGSGPYPD